MIRRWLEARRIQRKIALVAAMARVAERQGLWDSAACFREAEAYLCEELARTRQDA